MPFYQREKLPYGVYRIGSIDVFIELLALLVDAMVRSVAPIMLVSSRRLLRGRLPAAAGSLSMLDR